MDHIRTYYWLMEVKQLLLAKGHLMFFAVNMLLCLGFGGRSNLVLYLGYLVCYLVLRMPHGKSMLYGFILALPLTLFLL